MTRKHSIRAAAALLSLATISYGTSFVWAGEQSDKSLNDIGVRLDHIRQLPASERPAVVQETASLMEAMMKSGIDKKRQGAAHFLLAEIRFVAGDYAQAERDYNDAVKKDKNGPFADDAAFAMIIAIEAQGDDERANKAWRDWTNRYPDSPLQNDMLLARAWNAMRRDSTRECKVLLSELQNRSTQLDDPRVASTLGVLAYREGNFAEALRQVEPLDNATAIYLSALCYEAEGTVLKAAAKYQEVAERFPHSAFRDHAMLAKADVFFKSGAYKSAAEEFARVAEAAEREDIRLEAELMQAAAVFLGGDIDTGKGLLQEVTVRRRGTDAAARAQLLLGEVAMAQERFEEAILEFNRVLSNYFEHDLAANAQYQVARSLDALERHSEATSAYQLVVSGYPQSPQSPAAAYLAGAGLLDQGRPQAAAPYFQLVLDRYATASEAALVFASAEDQELVEAALCMLLWSYHTMDDVGRLAGVPHMLLQRMPPSSSPWRAYALLVDADALAAQGRHDEARLVLDDLINTFPNHDTTVPALRLLAWSYAQQGEDDLAIQTEESILTRRTGAPNADQLASVYLNKAHILFNRKAYAEAVTTYDDFITRFPAHEQQMLALYQAGLCHLRLGNDGNAVDRWEALTELDPTAEIAERAWARVGDVYFQNGHFEKAKQSYQGLIDNFPASQGAALGTLRLAQCEFNAEQDAEALVLFASVLSQWPGTGIAAEAERGIERSLYRLGQNDEGTEVLTSLVEQYPNSAFAADAQFEIANRLLEAKAYVDAAEAFRRVVTQFPDFSSADEAQFMMINAYEQLGDVAQAKAGYEQFLTFFPESELITSVRFRLGSLRFDDGDYMRAAVDFTAVTEADAPAETDAAATFNLALCKLMLGMNDEAKTALEAYRQNFPNDERTAEVAYQLGDLYEKAGDTRSAVNEYKGSLSAKPEQGLAVELHYRIGTCYETDGADDAALTSYRRAIRDGEQKDAFRLSALARVASLYEKQGDYQKAIAAYRDLIKNTDDPELMVAAQERASQLEAFAK